jgi:hypothetical protein
MFWKSTMRLILMILKGNPIGALSNCPACHTTAEKGIYDDDYVSIPR